MKAGAKLLISGYVQGVGFRHAVFLLAERLGVTGTVRNFPTGQVEVIAHAEEETLDAFIQEIKNGPVGEVSHVEITHHNPTRTYKDFEIVI